MRSLLVLLLLGIGLPGALAGAAADTAEPSDAFQAAAQAQVLASGLGRLLIPAIRYEEGYARHYDEQCTASLVALGDRPASRHLLSAWHCLEDYRDLSRPIVFESSDGERHAVNVIVSGGAMDSDWALLSLRREISGALSLAPDYRMAEQAVSLAGYPRDAGPAAAVTVLHNCALSGLDGRDRRTACVMQRGASGGAVLSDEPNPRFVGVISRGDGVSQSIFVPLARFFPKIRAYVTNAP